MPIQLCILPLGWQLNKQEGHLPNDKLLHLCLEYMKFSDKSEMLSFSCVSVICFFKVLIIYEVCTNILYTGEEKKRRKKRPVGFCVFS